MPFLATDLASGDARRARESAGRPASDVRPAAAGVLLLTRPCGSAVVVAHASPAARARGVRAGMVLGEARAICPEAIVLPHDAPRDARTLEHLAVWAQRFSPIVAAEPPDALLADVSGCERLFRGEAHIVRQAVVGLATQGIRARAAVADTIGAAWALSHAGSETYCVAPPGQHVPMLVGLPPTALRLDPATIERLDAVGIRTIGDLLMLPTATLPSRFGDELVRRLSQMLGRTAEWVEAPRAAPIFAARMAFGPSESRDVLMAAAGRVVAKLCERLTAGGAAARRLRVVVSYEQRSAWETWIGLSRPSRDDRHLFGLTASALERADLTTAAAGLMVLASETSRWRPTQPELFDDRPPDDAEPLGALLDRLALRLGGGAVVRAEAVDDHQPERAYRYVPAVDASGRRADDPPADATGADAKTGRPPRTAKEAFDRRYDPPPAAPGARPMVLLAKPRPIRVLALVPDGPPIRFEHGGQEHLVVHAAGPERLETGWWRGSDVRRDYFRVQTHEGRQFWLFRDLSGGNWYLHGLYE